MGKKNKSDNGIEKIKKRVDTLVKERPSHKEILEFFKDVVSEQYKIRSKVKITPVEIDERNLKVMIQEGLPLIDKRDLSLDVASATRLFKRLCKVLTQNKKSSTVTTQIMEAIRSKDISLVELFKQAGAGNDRYITEESKKLKIKDEVLSFLIMNSIRPILEAYANEIKGHVSQETWWRGYCPICGSVPALAELKENGARFLICSLCGFKWRFKRLQCPFCENEDHEKLRYLYTEKEGRAYRVDICEKCKRYIKTIDIQQLGEEVIPLIEDISTLHLDIIAQNEGYTREGIKFCIPKIKGI